MRRVLFLLIMFFISASLCAYAEPTFAPLVPVKENVVQPAESTETPAVNTLQDYKIPQEVPYFGGMPPVVEQRTLQGGTLLERHEIKRVAGKVTLLGGDIPVKVKPAFKISTSVPTLKVGDYVDFVVAEDVFHNEKLIMQQGTKVKGLVLKLDENTYMGKPAEITIGQFEIPNKYGDPISLKGTVNKKGNTHTNWISSTQYFIGPAVFWIRGGEVKLTPNADSCTLYIGDYTVSEDL